MGCLRLIINFWTILSQTVIHADPIRHEMMNPMTPPHTTYYRKNVRDIF